MLICDKRRPARAGNTNIRPPKGGRIKTAPPASGPRLGRSSAWGGTPPDPLGCAPWRAFAHRAPAASVSQWEGFRARVRQVAGVVNAQRCPRWTPSPLPLPWIQFFKRRATGAWASRRLVHRRASVPAAAAVGRPRDRPPGRLSTLGGQRGCPRPERATVQSASATRYPPAAGAPP